MEDVKKEPNFLFCSKRKEIKGIASFVNFNMLIKLLKICKFKEHLEN